MARGTDMVDRVTRKARRADELISGESAERASAKEGHGVPGRKTEV